MVIGAFPIAKLGALLLKQLSKPIATVVKERAKTHPFFRKYVCMPPAQFYNWCEIRTKMWLLNLGQPVNVPPMNEAMAIELGANLLGETVIFTIAAAILIYEYSRQSYNNEKKEKLLQDKLEDLESTIRELSFQEERHKAQIKELFRIAYDIDSRVVKVPWSRGGNNPHDKSDVPEASSKNPTPIVNEEGVIGDALSYIQKTVYRPRHNYVMHNSQLVGGTNLSVYFI